LRYSGTFVEIPGSQIEEYMAAFQENWTEYVRLKEGMPTGAEYQKEGRGQMQIRIGKFNEGVCLRSYHMPISTELQLQQVLGSYRYALQRAPIVQALLKQLSTPTNT